MARGLIPSLATPHPLGQFMPAVFHEDDMSQRFVGAFDEALAPIFSVLDNIDAYLDPRYSPEDFIEWLAGWVGVALDESWPLERRRAAVLHGAELYRLRGTPGGITRQVELLTGGTVELIESGAAARSLAAGGKLPGKAGYSLTVRVRLADVKSIDRAQVERLVAASRPAHVAFQVELVAR